MRNNARENIRVYLSKLDPTAFSGAFKPFFNNHNHAKLIGTENIVYIGSANFSDESSGNYETGIIIEDKEFIQRLYNEFFNNLTEAEDTISFYNEGFSAFQVFLYSLLAKFEHHYHKFVSEAYTSYESTDMTSGNPIFLDMEDIDMLYNDIDEFESMCYVADETYDADNEDYNRELEDLKARFNRLSTEWMKSVISVKGSLYELVNYNIAEKTNEILEKEYYAESWEENLDNCIKKSMENAESVYYMLYDNFEAEKADFLSEMERILSFLKETITFVQRWKSIMINQEIDNTGFAGAN